MANQRIISASIAVCLLLAGSCQSTNRGSERLTMGFAELCEALLEKQNKSDAPPPPADEARAVGAYSEDVSYDGDGSGGFREISIVDSDEEFSFELRGATLGNALDLIAETAGVNFVLNGNHYCPNV